MIFFKILDLSLFVNQLALLILELFLSNNPIIVDSLSLFLEVSQQFLLFLVSFFELTQLFSHWKLQSLKSYFKFFGLCVFYILSLIDTLLLQT